MKWSIHSLLAILFIISTITSSLHELMPHHSNSDCQVCTIAQNDTGLAPEIETISAVNISQFSAPLALQNQTKYHQTTTLCSRAPPLFS